MENTARFIIWAALLSETCAGRNLRAGKLSRQKRDRTKPVKNRNKHSIAIHQNIDMPEKHGFIVELASSLQECALGVGPSPVALIQYF
jgi:hypothetical protein